MLGVASFVGRAGGGFRRGAPGRCCGRRPEGRGDSAGLSRPQPRQCRQGRRRPDGTPSGSRDRDRLRRSFWSRARDVGDGGLLPGLRAIRRCRRDSPGGSRTRCARRFGGTIRCRPPSSRRRGAHRAGTVGRGRCAAGPGAAVLPLAPGGRHRSDPPTARGPAWRRLVGNPTRCPHGAAEGREPSAAGRSSGLPSWHSCEATRFRSANRCGRRSRSAGTTRSPGSSRWARSASSDSAPKPISRNVPGPVAPDRTCGTRAGTPRRFSHGCGRSPRRSGSVGPSSTLRPRHGWRAARRSGSGAKARQTRICGPQRRRRGTTSTCRTGGHTH